MGGEGMRRPISWAIVVLVAMLAVVASLYLMAWRSAQVDLRYPVDIKTVSVKHETTSVASPLLARGQRLVLVPGQDGLLRTFTYFEERWVGGQLRERRQVDPGARPTTQWIIKPSSEVVEVGGAAHPIYQLAANNERGLTIGKIGRGRTLSFRITGRVTFVLADPAQGLLGSGTGARRTRRMVGARRDR
jgi:hypothetical protein